MIGLKIRTKSPSRGVLQRPLQQFQPKLFRAYDPGLSLFPIILDNDARRLPTSMEKRLFKLKLLRRLKTNRDLREILLKANGPARHDAARHANLLSPLLPCRSDLATDTWRR